MKEAQNVKVSQLIQDSVGKVRILVVPEKGFCDMNREKIISALIARAGTGNMDVELTETSMDKLVYTESEKFKYIVSKLAKNNKH